MAWGALGMGVFPLLEALGSQGWSKRCGAAGLCSPFPMEHSQREPGPQQCGKGKGKGRGSAGAHPDQEKPYGTWAWHART